MLAKHEGKLPEAIKEDVEMLKLLNAEAGGMMPGITIYPNAGGTLQIDIAAWHWLRPLLKKLAEDVKE